MGGGVEDAVRRAAEIEDRRREATWPTVPAVGGPGKHFVTKDSGAREEFATGSRRDTRAGKGRYDLMSPGVLRRDAGLLERGAMKYGERNWEKGQPESRFADSMIRHALQYLAGDRSEDHLAAVRWNAGAIMHFEELERSDLLDMPWRRVPA